MKCSGFTDNTEVDEEVAIDGDVIKKFSYLRDVLSFRRVQEVVTT